MWPQSLKDKCLQVTASVFNSLYGQAPFGRWINGGLTIESRDAADRWLCLGLQRVQCCVCLISRKLS